MQRLRELKTTQTASCRHKGSTQTPSPPVTAVQPRVCVDNSLWLRRHQHRFSWNFDAHARGSRQQSRSTASRCPMTGTAGPQQALKGAKEPGTTGAGTAGRQRRRQARVGTHHPPAVCTDSRVGTGVIRSHARPIYDIRNFRSFFENPAYRIAFEFCLSELSDEVS